jgi:uncharacterized GH25 family protein
VTAGTPAWFQIESTHVPGRSEEIETAANVAVTLVAADGARPNEIVTNEKDLTLDDELSADGAAVLHVHRLGMVWSSTADGWQEGGRKKHPDAAASNKFEKFTKLLLNPAADPELVKRPLGDALEIVPLDDPGSLRVGDVFRVQVLHEGDPVPGGLQATRLGFTDAPSGYAWATESEDGTQAIKVTAPCPWLARADLEVPVNHGDVDQHTMRAILQPRVE